MTSIGSSAFYGCSNLTNVTIPDSVTSIGDYAFNNCDNLASITFADTNNWYYTNNSDYTNGTAIDVTDSTQNATYLKDTYYYCYWYKHVEITVTGDNAAKEISKLPLGSYTVAVTGAITNETISAIKKALKNSSNAMVNLDLSGTTGLTEIPDEVFDSCYNLTNVIIPDSVTSIGYSAFCDCYNLTNVTIPDSVTTIGGYVFNECSSLTSVTIGNGVTSVGNGAFYNSGNLTSVYLSDLTAWCNIEFSSSDANPLYYADNLYLNGSLVKNLVIPNDVTSIGRYAFFGCDSLTSVAIPDSVTSIGKWAFYNCYSLPSVTIPASITSIGEDAFFGCDSLTSIYISDLAAWCNIEFSSSYANPLYYANNLYLNGSLVKNLVIPNDVTTIRQYAFYDCDSLTSVTIPDSVTSIGEDAFYACGKLATVTIGSGVTKIYKKAFYYCDNLTSATFKDTDIWYYTSNSDFSDGIGINVTDPAQNATYLSSTYDDYYWYKK